MSKQGIGPHNALLLDMFGELVFEAWGEIGYLVGSSQRGESWRDIDVRVMLPLHQWLRFFYPEQDFKQRHLSPGWRAHMLAWSKLGERMTGLPIDFQVEPINDAPDGPRNPIGVRRVRMAQRDKEREETSDHAI